MTFHASIFLNIKLEPTMTSFPRSRGLHNPDSSHLTSKSKFKLGTPNLDQRCKIPWLRSLLFWGLIELDMSNLTYFQNPVCLYRFCIFEIFVRPAKNGWKRSLFHTLNGCAHICSPTWSCHGPWNSRVVSLVWPLLASQSSTRRLAIGFCMLL